MEPAPTFTVFTPTFNRSRTLHRVRNSLTCQSFRDFEWLIVDDGSSDNTAELVESWQDDSDFPIRYLRQENQGKHIAVNRGVENARGELFLILDSDDTCVPDALERFIHHWNAIPADIRETFSGVTCLCQDERGNIVGDTFPENVWDADYQTLVYKHRIRGEKWGFHTTAVMRAFPFPEVDKRIYVGESYVWRRIGRQYKQRHINEALRIYHQDETAGQITKRPLKQAARSRKYYLAHLREDFDIMRSYPMFAVRLAGNYARYSFHEGEGLWRQIRNAFCEDLRVALVLALCVVPGWTFFLRDELRERFSERWQ